jgi:hypothetical protein
MNRRQIINKILHDHIDVNRHEDYTNYKKLITAIEEWHESEVKKLHIHNVVGRSEQLRAFKQFLQSEYQLPVSNRMLDEFEKKQIRTEWN